jgi:hypothetical protein
MIQVLVALRAALAGQGFGEFAKILRRGREARKGRPLSAEERLEHRGVAFILTGFIAFMGYLVAPVLNAERWLVATFLMAAIVLVLVGLGHYVASGAAHGRGS